MTAFFDWLPVAYPWIKALHILSVISWMAGLLYLPRLFVYHTEAAAPGTDFSETLKIMERKLLRFIMNPAMFGAWIFGGFLLATPGIVDWGSFWVWVKLTLVTAMTWYHHALALWRKDFAEDRNLRSGRFYRIWNEVPAILMIGIVITVVVKPF